MSRSFRALLREGLQKFTERGATSTYELQEWLMRLHTALENEIPTDDESRTMLRAVLDGIFAREVGAGGTLARVAKRVPGVLRGTLARVAPSLRAQLDARIFAGVNLIRLNKRAAVEKTLQRFAGWISSVPPAGAITTDLRAVATQIAKPVAQIKFEARRVAIDQGHKLIAAVSHVVAMGDGAIAAIWQDRGENDHAYHARPEHLRRSGTLFLVRDSWAMEQGLVKKTGTVQYTDEIEQPAEFPYCSCAYLYLTAPQRLPRELLTNRGLAWVTGKPFEERVS